MTQTTDIVFKQEYTRLVAILVNKYGHHHLELVEDAVQEAFYKALKIWPAQQPNEPAAWILRVATNHLLDHFKSARVRHNQDFEEGLPEVGTTIEMPNEKAIKDDKLRMIFACCHPGLSSSDQLLLSLKFLCGFGNSQIARALVKSSDAIEKALGRAKKRFREKVASLDVPDADHLTERLNSVYRVIYLQFNEGYKVSSGDKLINHDICTDAIKLAELIATYEDFNTGELNALLALMYYQTSRFDARVNESNEIITLKDQDRQLWKQNHILQGNIYLGRSTTGNFISSYHLEAAIASQHSVASTYDETDWEAILQLYSTAIQQRPSPFYLLNYLIVYDQLNDASTTLERYKLMEEDLPNTHIRFVFYGDLLAQVGDLEGAAVAYTKAKSLTQNKIEIRFIEGKIQES